MIQTKSWNKNSFGLFDYESRDIQKKQLKVTGPCKLIRSQILNDGIEIETINEPHIAADSKNTQREQQLARLLFKNGNYWIYHKNQVDVSQIYQNPEEKLWLVIKKYQSKTYHKGYKLQKNDIVKFGRVRLRVRDIDYPDDGKSSINPTENLVNQSHTLYLPNPTLNQRRQHTNDEVNFANNASIDANDIDIFDKEMLSNQFEISINPGVQPNTLKTSQTLKKRQSLNNQQKQIKNENLNESTSSAAQCRICWGDEQEMDMNKDFNPLISPCRCVGSIGNIHLKCLKDWLETNKAMKTHKNQVVVKFKKLDCELCKQMFPFQIAFNNRIIDIVEVERPDKNFIILESLTYKGQKVFYIINTENKMQLKVGRGQDSDVRITDDISVSRCHALIQKTVKGDYILEDFNSKFGTLVQLQYPMLLDSSTQQNGSLVFQSGKTCLQIQVKHQVSCLPACFKPNQRSPFDNLISVDNRNYFPKEYYKPISPKKTSNRTKNKVPKILAKIINEDDDEGDENQNINQDPLFSMIQQNPDNAVSQFEVASGRIGADQQENYISIDDDNENFTSRLRSIPRDEGISSYQFYNSGVPRLGEVFSANYTSNRIQIIQEQEENFDPDESQEDEPRLDLQASNMLNKTMLDNRRFFEDHINANTDGRQNMMDGSQSLQRDLIRRCSKRSKTPNHRASQIFKNGSRDLQQMTGDIANYQEEDEKIEDSIREFEEKLADNQEYLPQMVQINQLSYNQEDELEQIEEQQELDSLNYADQEHEDIERTQQEKDTLSPKRLANKYDIAQMFRIYT
ncbi:fha domain [Stylonychia lemnae]|uniref:Fha domain n=1 Tax=Stylonychia lemnae TaxID=5949 RepID=A0A077ZUQ1_STYLE|nr:fha domain [Stylonychia lemnae]|eukprot:CDW73638.1 fha domain [Stylonychia lemnae]